MITSWCWELRGGGKWRVTADGFGGLGGDESVLKLGSGNGCTALSILKNH